MKRILVFVPTYNEHENISILYKEIKALNLGNDFLLLDDNSPDGTGRVMDEIARNDNTVHVIHRPSKMGLGTAQMAAYEYARAHAYDLLVTLDADLTHDPQYIPAMLAASEQADIVIGSRYAAGGSMSGWSKIRLPFTLFWRNMIKYCLGMPYDCTGAYRVYRVSILDPTVYSQCTARGFAFGMGVLFYLVQAGARVAQVPIHARSRQHGESKLSGSIMKEAAICFFQLCNARVRNWFRNTISKKELL